MAQKFVSETGILCTKFVVCSEVCARKGYFVHKVAEEIEEAGAARGRPRLQFYAFADKPFLFDGFEDLG